MRIIPFRKKVPAGRTAAKEPDPQIVKMALGNFNETLMPSHMQQIVKHLGTLGWKGGYPISRSTSGRAGKGTHTDIADRGFLAGKATGTAIRNERIGFWKKREARKEMKKLRKELGGIVREGGVSPQQAVDLYNAHLAANNRTRQVTVKKGFLFWRKVEEIDRPWTVPEIFGKRVKPGPGLNVLLDEMERLQQESIAAQQNAMQAQQQGGKAA